MLYLEVDANSPVPIFEQIIGSIQRLVREKKLAAGMFLPPVRQLAADLEINPNTVARAYGQLEKDGIIETARRRGTKISDSAPSLARQSLTARVEKVVDQIIRDTTHLGLDHDDLMAALVKRLGATTRKTSESKRRPL